MNEELIRHCQTKIKDLLNKKTHKTKQEALVMCNFLC